ASGMRGSVICATRSPGPTRRPPSRNASTSTSIWPRRRCATAPDPAAALRLARAAAGSEEAGQSMVVEEPHRAEGALDPEAAGNPAAERGKTVHGEAANAGHRVLAPDDAEVEAYLETALNAPAPQRPTQDRPVEPDAVVVLDFGSQFAQLIARRVRELNVYSELLPHDTPWAELERRSPKAIILSVGPNSVYDEDAPRPDPAIWRGEIPVLGICYGAQLMAHELGGDVLPTSKREYGPATVTITTDDGLFDGLDRDQPVWMSHGD